MKTVLVFLCLVPMIAFTQDPGPDRQIRELKNTLLLVELRDAGMASEALKTSGELTKATRMERKVREQNLKIASAFREYFHFCPVYFFYDQSRDEVKRMHFQGNLLDHDLAPVQSVSRPVPMFYAAAFGYLDARPAGSKSGRHVKALMIRDHNFVQLKEPFPYYVRTCSLDSHYGKKVKKLNKKLDAYYHSLTSGH